MATRIIEYRVHDKKMPLVDAPSVAEQAAITATGTSAQSAALNDATNVICIQSDEAVYIKIGENPTATTNSYRIQAGGEQFFHIVRGASLKVAVRT